MGQGRILAVAAICLLGAGLFGYLDYAVLDERVFADRAASTLASDEVRSEIGARLGKRLATERPELAAGENVMEDAVADGVAAEPAFQHAFHTASLRMHRSLFGDAHAEVSFRVDGSAAALRAELRRRLPIEVPRMVDVPLLTVDSGGREHALRALAPAARAAARPAAVFLGVLGAGLLALAVVRDPDRRRGVWGAGLAVAAAAGLAAAGVTAGRDLVLEGFDTSFGDAVAGSVWDAYMGDLRMWALALCAVALVVAAAAGGPRPAVSTLLAAPASAGGRLLRAAALLAVAALAVQVPELVLHTGLVALAAVLVYVAAGDLLRLRPGTARPAPRPAAASAPSHSSTAHPRSSSRPHRTW